MSCPHQEKGWIGWRDPWVWVPVSGILLLVLGGAIPGAVPFSRLYWEYLPNVLPPLGLGILLGGLIQHLIPTEYIIKLLAGSRKRVILRAAFLGFLASACSHGCLALALALYRKGASVPSVISFLLASPWANLSLTLLLLSLFGRAGLAIIAAAFGVAILTGLVFQRLDRHNKLEKNPTHALLEEGFSIRRDLRRRFANYCPSLRQLTADLRASLIGGVELGRMLLGWVQLGLVLSVLLGVLIPHTVFMRYLGPEPLGMAFTLAAATVVEVCSEGTAPVAFELYRNTGALGNSFIFLMAGVVTDYTELGMLWSNIGKQTVFYLLVVSLPLVLLIAAFMNGLI